MSEILSIKSYFNREYIRFSILGHSTTNPVLTDFLSLDQDAIVGVSEAHVQVLAFIAVGAVEVLTDDIYSFIVRGFNRTVCWGYGLNLWSIIIQIRVVLAFI